MDEVMGKHDFGAVLRTDYATLRAAALDNRTWFASALPFLWHRPSERALAVDAVTTPERRQMYAVHIREVSISSRKRLMACARRRRPRQ